MARPIGQIIIVYNSANTKALQMCKVIWQCYVVVGYGRNISVGRVNGNTVGKYHHVTLTVVYVLSCGVII